MSGDILLVIQDIAFVVAAAVFLFAASRAVTIGRALVRRVYRNRAYVAGAFAVFLAVVSLLPVYWSENAYLFELIFVFVLLDSTILVSLDTDFFHRNTLRWRQGRLVGYSMMAYLLVASYFLNFPPTSYIQSLFIVQVSPLQLTPLGEIVFAVEGACLFFALTYVLLTAVVSARRSSDMILRKFLEYTGLLLFFYLVNTVIWTFITQAISPFFFVVFAYVTYRMAMSLSPVGKIQKAVEATTPAI